MVGKIEILRFIELLNNNYIGDKNRNDQRKINVRI